MPRITTLIIVFLFSINAFANDSIARVGAGGIVLLKSDHIKMVEETLEISTKKIRVQYLFRNEAAEDIKTIVAFPLPRRQWNPENQNTGSLRDFKLKVDGKSTPTMRERKAIFDDRDITAHLHSIGLTEKQIFETFGGCADDVENVGCDLTQKQRAELDKIAGKKNAYHPIWKIDETYYWEQSFPAGKELEVQHEYRPFVGRQYHAPYQRGFEFVSGALIAPDGDGSEACVDESTVKTLIRRVKTLAKNKPHMVYVSVSDVEYVLGTGRNWKGTIGRFKLRLKKEHADEIVSVCMQGRAQKLDATTLEFNLTDFVPQDRLVVYFYNVSKTDY